MGTKVEPHQAIEDEDEDDEIVVLPPPVKPPPLVIELDKSDDEKVKENTTPKHSHKKTKKRKKDGEQPKGKHKHKHHNKDVSPVKSHKEKSSDKKLRKKSSDKTDDKSKHKTKSKKSKSTVDLDESETLPEDSHVIDEPSRNVEAPGSTSKKSLTKKSSSKSSRASDATETIDNVAKGSNKRRNNTEYVAVVTPPISIFDPSSSALSEPVHPDVTDPHEESTRSHYHSSKSKKRKRDETFERLSPSKHSRKRTSSKSAEEESREDSLRFAQHLGLPVEEPVGAEAEPEADLPRKRSSRKSKQSRWDVTKSMIAEDLNHSGETGNTVEENSVIGPEVNQQEEKISEGVSSSDNIERSTSTTEVNGVEEQIARKETEENDLEIVSEVRKSNKRTPDIFPFHWTPRMKRYYGEVTAGIDEERIKSRQSSDKRKWVIDDSDRNRRSTQQSRIRCLNCNQRGHIAIYCPEKPKGTVCHVCGAEGHCYLTYQGRRGFCPNTMCLVCGGKTSEYLEGCNRCIHRNPPLDCSVCGMKGHNKWFCPDTWRRYFNTTKAPVETQNTNGNDEEKDNNEMERKYIYIPKFKSSCANCGMNGHNYFHCKSPRPPEFIPNKPFIIEFLPPESTSTTADTTDNSLPPQLPGPSTTVDRTEVSTSTEIGNQTNSVAKNTRLFLPLDKHSLELLLNKIQTQPNGSKLDCFEKDVSFHLDRYKNIILTGPSDGIEVTKQALLQLVARLIEEENKTSPQLPNPFYKKQTERNSDKTGNDIENRNAVQPPNSSVTITEDSSVSSSMDEVHRDSCQSPTVNSASSPPHSSSAETSSEINTSPSPSSLQISSQVNLQPQQSSASNSSTTITNINQTNHPKLFYEDQMTYMFDVDERRLTPNELSQQPVIVSEAFKPQSKEYIVIPIPTPVQVMPSQSSSQTSLPIPVVPSYNLSSHNIININSIKQIAANSGQDRTATTSKLSSSTCLLDEPASSPEVELIEEIIHCDRSP